MAEAIAAIGVVASAAQLADFGFRLSVKLFAYSKAVASADTSIKDISNDVSLTSTVLKELCQILQSDDSHVVSENAVQATSQTVKECLLVFEQLNDALDKSLANLGVGQSNGKAKRGLVALEKLKWPFKQNKMEFLRSNLDRLKASLTLMLQVQSYARDLSNRKAADASIAYQEHLIEALKHSLEDTNYRYLSLQRAIEGEKAEPVLNTFINTSVHITEARDMGIMSQSAKDSEASVTPVVHHRTVIGELLLCFQLLNDVLGYHMAISNLSKLSSMGYNQLRVTLEKIHVEELSKLKEDFRDDPIQIKAEAAQNLETRLKELARVGYLRERKQVPIEHASNTQTLSASLEILKEEGDRAFGMFQDDLVERMNFGIPMPGSVNLNETLIEYRHKYQQIMKKFQLEAQKMEKQKHNMGQKRLQSAGPGMTVEEYMISTRNARSQEAGTRPPAYDPYESSDLGRAAALQVEIDSTTNAMRENINKISQRGERLDSLHDKTENLSVSSQGFRRGITRVKKAEGLWAQAYRGVTEGVGIVGAVGIDGYKAVKVATGLLQAREDEPEIPGSVGSTSPIGLTPLSPNLLSERFDNRRVSFDDDDDDLEAVSGLEAMRIAEEQDIVAGKQAAIGLGSSETLPPYSSVEDSDNEYKYMDLGLVGGGHETHLSYGEEEAKEDSEDEDIVGDLLSQWTNLPSNLR